MATRAKSNPLDGDIHHLHVVIDDVLHKRLEKHASKMNANVRSRRPKQTNLSAAVRDLLRTSLGLTA